jgi:hypothetical protein
LDTTAQREPPDTATGVLEEELTPLEDCRLPELVPELLDDDEVDVEDELEVEVDEEPAVVLAAVAEPEVDVPGMVAALTAPKSPTPAIAPRAAPVVSRFRVRIAESLARILASICPWLFMIGKFGGRR